MGLIGEQQRSSRRVFGDQWKEIIFYCGCMSSDTLVSNPAKKLHGVPQNRHGSQNIISNGSVIAVNDGQCMIIVKQGKVVDVCAEPGDMFYDSFTEPSLFCPVTRRTGIVQVFDQMENASGFGGETPGRSRVYFINTKKELTKANTEHRWPVPFQ